MQIKWTELALDDLEAIQACISKDSIFYAKQFIERFFETVGKLKDFPELGRRVPEAEERKDVREINCNPLIQQEFLSNVNRP